MNAELQSDPNIVEPQPPTSPPVQSEIITIGKGLTKAFLFDKRIVIFHLDTVARDIIDAGAKDVLETMKNWPTKHQYLVIYDITSAKIALTPHLRQRLQELAKAYPDLKGRSAVVLPRSVITQVFKLFVIAQNRVGRRKQVFFDRESAIAWLQQVMVDP
jgi:hypothetical protein